MIHAFCVEESQNKDRKDWQMTKYLDSEDKVTPLQIAASASDQKSQVAEISPQVEPLKVPQQDH